MRQRLLHLALAGLAVLVLTSGAEARGRRGGGGGGGCGGGGCGGGGYHGGGCATGHCGPAGGGMICGPGGCHAGHAGHAGMAGSMGYSGYGAGGMVLAASTPAPANLVVTLPADARLTVDGHQTTSTSGERTFVTPDLPQGREFQYTLVAEVMRDGQRQTVTQRVTVRAGEETRVQLQIPAAVASR